jgi:hypothetical protein
MALDDNKTLNLVLSSDMEWISLDSGSLQQAVEAHRVVRCQGSHIFSRQSAHRWR